MYIRLAISCLLLAACREAQPPTPTADESAQLNEAEDLLNDTSAGE